MKKILTVLICTVIPMIAFAWEGTATANASVIRGSGEVLVNQSTNANGTFAMNSSDQKSQSGGTFSSKKATFYFHAKPAVSCTFAGWYNDVDGTSRKSSDNPFKVQLTAYVLDPAPTATYYAVFEKIITCQVETRTIIKTGETGSIDVPVSFYNAANFSKKVYDASDNVTTKVTCTGNNPSASGASTITFTITAGADTKSGEEYRVVFTADDGKGNSATHTIVITVYDEVQVTYQAPSEGGRYTIDYQDNSGTSKTLNVNDPIYPLTINNPDLSFKLTATPSSNTYRFSRWIIRNNGRTTTSPINPYVDYVPNDGDVVTAEFIETKYAMFQVYGQGGVFYSDLHDGLTAAANSSNVLMVYQSGELKAGHYEIPTGVTLLVPGTDIVDNKATYRIGDVVLSDFTETSPTSRSCKKYLQMQPYTTIDVKGNISVYAVMSMVMGSNGTPKTYGRILMDDSCHITLHGGSVLSALGYITGKQDDITGEPTSSITAEADAIVYEAFQIADWRGGSATLTLSGLDYGALVSGKPSVAQGNQGDVFPVGQYYVQSIETKLILKSGAVEKLSTAVDMSVAPVEANALFVVPDNYGKYNGAYTTGLFRLGEGTQLEKYYDKNKDRQCFKIVGVQKANNTYSSAKLDNIELLFPLAIEVMGMTMHATATISSKSFTLPITNNLDIEAQNVYVETLSPLAFLPGSTFKINETSKIFVNSKVYVYDKEQMAMYFHKSGGNEAELILVNYTPDGKHYGIRNVNNTKDVTWTIDGELIVNNTGELYTTTIGGPGKSSNILDYGANIKSTGNGKVIYYNIGSEDKTYQYDQAASSFMEIPITNALLSNDTTIAANKLTPYSAGNTANRGDIYTYVKSQGRWLLPQALTITKSEIAPFYLTLPKDTIHELVCIMHTHNSNSTVIEDNFDIELEKGEDSKFEVLSKEYGLDTDGNYKLRVQVKYKHQHKHNADTPYEENIVVKCKDLTILEGDPVTHTETIKLTATENYMPNFAVTIDGTPVENGGPYSMSANLGFSASKTTIITPAENNVATLDVTQWNYSATPTPQFSFGSDDGQLKLTFTPTDLNSVTGTLILTASYTDDANNTLSHSVTINLNATADKQPNSLAFIADKDTVIQGGTKSNIFANLGSGIDNITSITYKYEGENSHELVELVREDNNYKIVAKEVESIVQARTVTIEVTQGESDVMYGGKATIQVTILPLAIWHWSNMYFNSTYVNPLTPPQSDEEWSLNLVSCKEEAGDQDDKSWITLDGDYASGYYATVGTPSDVTKTYKAIFHFMQGEYEKDFESTIYADPRILSYCVTTDRIFTDVTTFSNGVIFEDATDRIIFNRAATWEFEMIGVPDELTFTPTGSNTWMIQERASSSDKWTNVISWTQLREGKTVSFSLKPTTRQVSIKYGEITNIAGTITGLCVSKLSLKTSAQRVYLPVNEDTTFVKSITLTHALASAPSVEVEDSKLDLDIQPVSSNLGSDEDPYYTTEVKIKSNSNTPVDEEIELTISCGNETIQVVVRTYEFPQGLPIRLKTDNPAERFHFVTTDSMKYAQWNESTRQLTMVNPGAQYIPRFVIFAFEGAPSVIKFDISDIYGNPIDVIDQQWTIKESVDGKHFNPASGAKRDSIGGNKLVQGLNYQTRYVLVEYSAVSLEDVVISNLVIEGYPQVLVDPLQLRFDSIVNRQFTVTAINLDAIRFELDNDTAFALTTDTANYTISDAERATITTTKNSHNNAYAHALGTNKVGDIVLGVKWLKANALDEGQIKIYNANNDSLMAVVSLLGADNYLVKGAVAGIFTGIPDGTIDAEKNYTYHGKSYKDYKYHQIDLTSTFATDSTALFDYLFIYGETTTTDGKKDITAPKTHPTLVGSNALTPLYVYRKALNTSNKYKGYEFVGKLDNVNVALKDTIPGIIEVDTAGTVFISDTTSLKVYMTGFCPYATTGYTKNQEGVFLFRGKHGAQLDIYLENFHVFSRNKTQYGNAVNGKEGAEVFTNGYARGSGSVLVFENMDPQEQLQNFLPFEVTIHTKGNNYLSSNNGCFFGLSFSQSGEIAMKATQVSSPIYVHMYNTAYARKTKTTLNFTDEWPETATMDSNGKYTENIRTNGFLALKKQSNNAPSIDLGNKYTEVNFWGGRVELQNSQIGSDTYKTTLAISHRSGYFGADGVGVQLCYGLGTDSVGGTVNFYDGTVTVRPMKVAAAYRQYYLMDVQLNADGDTVRDANENVVYTELTSCLRLPMNTYVQGGSHAFMRACQHVTSKGGAPKDAPNGKLLGQYVYTMQDGKDTMDETTKLATITGFPGNITGLSDYHGSRGYTYGLNSVTPDGDKLYFWIPNGFGGVTAEEDKLMSTWKACMTEIAAGIPSVAEGRIGGDTPIEQNEEVKYFLYCKIDEDIKDVIRAGEKNAEGEVLDYTYLPPFEVPSAAKSFFNDATYARYDLLTYVSDSLQYQVVSDTAYTITDRVYYITTATADIWQTFTAPFDVANIYIMETYPESKLEKEGTRSQILKAQATHNADFAAFFAVAMAMGTYKDFEGIYDSYIAWAQSQDNALTDLWDGTTSTYTLRGKQRLIPYVGSNWRDANFYLNENKGNWTLNDKTGYFDVNWETLTADSLTKDILLHKGKTYSLMFPYCPNCEADLDSRIDWDYWSGKFLIFESTAGAQVINGRDFLNDTIAGHIFTQAPSETEVVVTGNSTFARLETNRENLYVYESGYPMMKSEIFLPPLEGAIVQPTTAFLYGNVPTRNGMPAKAISRSGQIIYDNSNDNGDGTTTGGNIPTVGGGNDLFITSTMEGINIAVAEPQQVRVLSSTGAVIFSGMVQTAVDVLLPTTGVYVITGENEVHKILH